MLVGRGALTFRTYLVSGKNPTPSEKTISDKLSSFRFTGLGRSDEGAATGWIAPDHLFDGEFDAAKVFHGRFACFALRIDTRRIPSALLAAHVALEEKAWRERNGDGKIPGGQRREIRRDVKAKLLAEIPPVQRAYGVFWNVRAKKLHFQSLSKGTNQELVELFARTFDLGLEPTGPSALAHDTTEQEGENERLTLLQDASPLSLKSAAADKNDERGKKKAAAAQPASSGKGE